jgi:hypothetical protein
MSQEQQQQQQRAIDLINQQQQIDNSLHPSQYHSTQQPHIPSPYAPKSHQITPYQTSSIVKTHAKSFTPYPERICQDIAQVGPNVAVNSGYFPLIDRVYVTIGSKLYLWNQHANYSTTVLVYESEFIQKSIKSTNPQQPSQPFNDEITHVLVAPAFQGCFESGITHILLLIYKSHIQLLTIQPQPQSPIDTVQTGLLSSFQTTNLFNTTTLLGNNSPNGETNVNIYNSIYFGKSQFICPTPSDHSITSIISTSSGRIFCGLSNSHLAEIIYAESLLPSSKPFLQYIFGKSTTEFTTNVFNTVMGEIAQSLIAGAHKITNNKNQNQQPNDDDFYDRNSTDPTSRQRNNNNLFEQQQISLEKIQSTIQFRQLTQTSMISLLIPIWDSPSPIIDLSIDESRYEILLFVLHQDQTINCYSLDLSPFALRPKSNQITNLIQYYTTAAFSEQHHQVPKLIATLSPKQLQQQIQQYTRHYSSLFNKKTTFQTLQLHDLYSIQAINSNLSKRFQCLVTTTNGHRVFLSLFALASEIQKVGHTELTTSTLTKATLAVGVVSGIMSRLTLGLDGVVQKMPR